MKKKKDSVSISMQMIASHSCLLIVDVQERLTPVTHEPRKVIVGLCHLDAGGRALTDVPIVVSEQYTRGLGPTMVDLLSLAPPDSFIEKTVFGCAADAAIMARLERLNWRQVVIAGVETHVCALQSALGLKEKGFYVFVVVEACSARRPESEQVACARLAMAGVAVVTIEMVLFEWLGGKDHPAFKDVQRLIQ